MEVEAKGVIFQAQERFPHPLPASVATLAETDEPHQAGAREAAEGSVETKGGF